MTKLTSPISLNVSWTVSVHSQTHHRTDTRAVSVIASLQWAPRPRNGEVIYACEGEDVTIPWDFTLTAGEDITSIEWLFRGASQEMVAMYSHATFIPLPAFSGRVQRVASGGLILRHVTTADAGNFTIEINGKQNTANLFESRKVVLQVNGK